MPPSFSDEGLAAAQTIRAAIPAWACLVLSQHVDPAYALRCSSERSGRVGYLLKDRIADVATLVDALGRVHAGETVVDPGLVSELLDAPRQRDPLAALTPASARCSRWSPKGGPTAGSPRRCGCRRRPSRRTSATIFRKLDLPSAPSENRRVHAVLTFLDLGSRT